MKTAGFAAARVGRAALKHSDDETSTASRSRAMHASQSENANAGAGKDPGAGQPSGKNADAQQKAGKPDDRALENAQQRLKERLGDLEKEYERLSKELQTRRKERAERLKAERAMRQRRDRSVARIDRIITKGGEAAGKQSRFLEKMKTLHDRNEELLASIAERLERVEEQARSGQAGAPELKDELIGMLREIQVMRARREKIAAQIQKL